MQAGFEPPGASETMESAIPPELARRRFFSRRRLTRWGFCIVAGVPLWLIISFIVARQLTQRPRVRFDEPAPQVDWANFRSVRLGTTDGHEIGGWYAEGSRPDAPSVILLHGNGGQRLHMLDRAQLFASRGCAVLPISLRAHGDSTGDRNDIGYSARHDVVAAVDFLERKRPGRPIVVVGASLGAAAATFASDFLDHRVSGYILEAPYLDLRVAVRNRTRQALPIGLEWVAYQGMLTVAPLVIPDLDKISPRDAIVGVPEDIPILIIAGREDRKTTPEQVQVLFERVRSHAKLIIFEKAGHLHYAETDPKLYESEVFGFLSQLSRKPTAVSTSSNRSQ